jgi:putative oxidoreductase
MKGSQLTSDIVILIARIAVGVTLLAHGWQKFFTNGIGATADSFEAMGVTAPTFSAVFAAVVELVGGILLIVGLFTPVVAVLVVIDMIGAWWFVHRDAGTIFADGGGYEVVLLIAAGSVLVGALLGGKFSLDRAVFGRRRSAQA